MEFRTKVGNFDLFGVYFISPKLGWVVGERGKIFWTDDGGRTWLAQKSNVDSDLYAITCSTIRRCWVVGANGVILRSDDGLTWKPLGSGTQKALNAVDFLDEKNGFAVGDDSTILKTADGGLSWKKQKLEIEKGECEWLIPSRNEPISNLLRVTFLNHRQAWVSGDLSIARTADGGIHWRGACPNDSPFVGIVVGEDGIVYAVTPNGFNLISHDSGRTWNKQAIK